MAEPVVKFDNVSIVFGDKPKNALPLIDEGKSRAEIQQDCGQILGVADCSLEIEEGEVLVLMGLSGSGKSTLLRAVNGLNPVVRGNVSVRCPDNNGRSTWRDPHTCSKAELRELRLDWVSMVFQQFGLLPWRTVEENVGFGLELAGRDTAETKRKVSEQLELVGLADWAGKRVQELSGGMQQRVGLARALTNDAPILLMDEAFSALDPLIRMDMQSVLLDLQKEIKKTVVFITHDLDEALRLGDRIAILRDGEIVQQGTGQEIVLKPADDYISNFVKEVNRGRVILVETVMDSVGDKLPDLRIVKGTVLEEAAKQMTEVEAMSATITDAAGKPIGVLRMQSLIAAMVTPVSHDQAA